MIPIAVPDPVSRRLADTSLAKELVGFEAEVSLEEGLARFVEWWRTSRREDQGS